jgi:5-methyltetrahydropteroyltriglutamate--homocysteine methyltransferase
MTNIQNLKNVKTHTLGASRMGEQRQLKFALEQYWQGKTTSADLLKTAHEVKRYNWNIQKQANLDFVTVGDFAFYDHVLNTACYFNAIHTEQTSHQHNGQTCTHAHASSDEELLKQYFSNARGGDCCALEMTKWFNTNYHYIVSELDENTKFSLSQGYVNKFIIDDVKDAYAQGHENVKAVLLGPVSYLYLSKAKNVNKLDLLPSLIACYAQLLSQLKAQNITWVQIDEPILSLDLGAEWHRAIEQTYSQLHFEGINILVATYFGALQDNLQLACNLAVQGLHIDAVSSPQELQQIIDWLPNHKVLSVGVVDGRNIWKTDLEQVIAKLEQVATRRTQNVWLAPSCSLLHVPVNLELEQKLNPEIKNWLAFAKQKLQELDVVKSYINNTKDVSEIIKSNSQSVAQRKNSILVNNPQIKQDIQQILVKDGVDKRNTEFANRKQTQQEVLQLPLLPTTTIGSFPQTAEVRSLRARYKKSEITEQEYTKAIQELTIEAVKIQEEIGIDVLVHGEFERNDMVEYFAEYLNGFTFTENGWVQSYGSRCVKPPVIYGDVSRKQPITVAWSQFAQEQTKQIMKGMLTGPVTMLHWAFVRDDQSKQDTCLQIAVALRHEVNDLEQAGIKIIQIDEPAYREGLPLRKQDWQNYLAWASQAFRISSSGVDDKTQIHTHMCYSEFGDILPAIAAMDADVISIETTRSNMDLLDSFVSFKYPNDIGPGVWDIHSPRIPSSEEMTALINKAIAVLPIQNLWINPDCGLKTRNWEQTKQALTNLVETAKQVRIEVQESSLV